MIITKNIDINNKYKVMIKYHEDSNLRLYSLVDDDDNQIIESFNRDTFLMKVNKIVKLNNKLECIIASY